MPAALLVGLVLAAAPEPPDDEAHRDALARFGVGVLRARDDRPVEAVKQFEAAVRKDPAAVAPLRHLVNLYVEIGRDPAAIRTAESVLRLDPDDAETSRTLGRLLSEAKRPADAARVLNRAADSPRLANRFADRLAVLRDAARAFDEANDPAGAEDSLRKALAITNSHRDALLRSDVFPTGSALDRETASLHEKLGQAFAARKKFPEAEAEFAAAAALFRDKARANAPQAAARLEWNLSAVAAGRGDTNAAVAHLTKFLSLEPRNPEPYERLAELLRQSGRPGVSAATLAGLAERSPKIPAIRWVQAAEVGRTNPDRANALFRDMARSTTDPAFFRIAVRHYREANRPADLLALTDDLYRAARLNGTDEDAPTPAGTKPPTADPVAVARAQAVTAAIRADREACRQLIGTLTTSAGSQSKDTWELLTTLAEREGRPDQAERAARQLWAAESGGRRGIDTGFRRLYKLITRQRKWEAALDLCDSAERSRDFSLGWYYRAAPLAELGRSREALASIDSAAPNLRDSLDGRLLRARVLCILDRHTEAAAVCREAIKDAGTPDDALQARFTLSDALLGLKDYAGAEAELRAVLDDDPDDAQALNNLGYNLADQGRKLDEAEELIRRAVQIERDARARAGNPEPENGVYSDSLGWVLFRRGKLAEARNVMESAVALPDSVSDAVVWDHLGDVAFRQGDKARAKQAWSKATGLYLNSHQGRQAGRQAEVTRKLRLVP